MKEEDFSVIKVNARQELKNVYDIRYSGDYWNCWEDKNYKTEKEFFSDERKRDNLGIVLAFRDKDCNTIGALRFIKVGQGNTLTEKIMKEQGIECPNLENSWEGGRLILDEKNRNQQNMLYFVSLALKWLVGNTNANYVFAHCPEALGRVYKKFGFKIIGGSLKIPCYKKKYVVIFGDVLQIVSIIENIKFNLSKS